MTKAWLERDILNSKVTQNCLLGLKKSLLSLLTKRGKVLFLVSFESNELFSYIGSLAAFHFHNPRNLKLFCFQTYESRHKHKETHGVCARCNAALPVLICIVWSPGRPVISVPRLWHVQERPGKQEALFGAKQMTARDVTRFHAVFSSRSGTFAFFCRCLAAKNLKQNIQ